MPNRNCSTIVVYDHKYAATLVVDEDQQQQTHRQAHNQQSNSGGLGSVPFERDFITHNMGHDSWPGKKKEKASSNGCSAVDQLLFHGSRIGVPTFCDEFMSIVQTFSLSDRASSDLINLMKSMAPPNNNFDRCMNGIEQAWNIGAFKCQRVPMPSEKWSEQRTAKCSTATTATPMSVQRDTVQQHDKNGEDMLNVLNLLHHLSNDVSKLRRECAAARSAKDSDFPVLVQNISDTNININDDVEEEFELEEGDDEHEEDDGMALPNSSNGGDEVLVPSWHDGGAGGGAIHVQNHLPKLRQRKQELDSCRLKYFVKIVDEHGQVMPICDLRQDDLVSTVRVSREDPNTPILYHGEDITGRVLRKLDISLHLHNPSYCGRAVADALFDPSFLCHFHIVPEGKTGTRSNRHALPTEMLQVFYDTLRKLGVSRIIPQHQHGWMEQARDAVNQRNRDIKIPGCRRKFFHNSDPIFK